MAVRTETKKRFILGERFNRIRLSRVLGYQNFANILGCTKARVAHICTGRRGVTDQTLIKCREKLRPSEVYFILTGRTQAKKETVEIEGLTTEESEIIKLLRKLPKTKETLLISLRFKARQNQTDYIEYMNR